MRTFALALPHVVVLALLAASLPARAQENAAPDIAGRWTGAVDTDAGRMDIEITLALADGRVSGSIATRHGDLSIKNGTYAKGRWTLPFAGHGMEGRLVATLNGDVLSGDWVNPGVATGRFEVKRTR